MSQPLRDSDYFTPPPQKRPYGAPAGSPTQPAAKGDLTPPGAQQLATPGRRLVARIIDAGIVAVIALPFTAPLLSELFTHLNDKVATATATGSQASLSDPTTIRLTLLLTAVVLAASFGYEVPQLLRWGQTLGKRITRIKVVPRNSVIQGNARTESVKWVSLDQGEVGARLGAGPVVLRWLTQTAAPQVPWIGIGIWLLDSLWLLWDKPWRQCLHDKVASTIVIAVP